MAKAATSASLNTWWPGWARPAHPVFRFEARRWRRSRASRLLRGSVWVTPIILLLGILVALGAAGLSANALAPQSDVLIVAGGTYVFLLATVSALFNWLVGLAGSLLGASLIARERETQNWPFLRVTTLSTVEIVGGKLAALLQLLVKPAHAIALLRLGALGGGAVALGLAVASSGVTPEEALDAVTSFEPLAFLPASSLLLAASVGGLGLLAWITYWLIEPYFNVLYNSAIGMTASSLARTRGLAIGLTFVIHLILGLAVYAPVQQFAYLLFAFGFGQLGDLASNVLTTLILFTLQFGLLIGLQGGAMLACLAFTLKRLDGLGE
jgi:hypothetical protein